MVALAAVALGITYGYDISNIAGALIFLPKDLSLDANQSAALATAVVIGQIVGALTGGPLSEKIGRKPTMVIVAAGYALFAILSGIAPGYVVLLVVRFLLGVTVGFSLSVVPVFVAENSPANVRGGLLTAYQVTTVFGIVIGYLVAWALTGIEGWRWMLALAALPAIAVLLLLINVQETPNWYVSHGRPEKARAALKRLDPESSVDDRMALIEKELSQETGRLGEMFKLPLLRATLFVIVLGFFIQITGINATIYYAPEIFGQMGFKGYPATLGLPAVVQFASLISVVASMLIIDRVGRRTVLISGITSMIVSTIVLVVVYSPLMSGDAKNVLGLIGIIVFTMGYTFGFGSIVWVYAGETFPAKYRALGSSLMLTADLIANAIVAQAFPPLLAAFGPMVMFIGFGVLALLALLFVLRFAPETKGRELSTIATYWENGAKWPEGTQNGVVTEVRSR